MIELKTLVLLLGTERGRFKKLLPLIQPHKTYLVMKNEEFYTAKDWKTIQEYIDEIEGLRDPKTIERIPIKSSGGKVNFSDAFETLLGLMHKERNQKHKVIVAISGGTRILICAAIIAASLTESEIYYMSKYAKVLTEEAKPIKEKEENVDEWRNELIHVPAFPIGLPDPVRRLILMHLLDSGADSHFVFLSVKDLLKAIKAKRILGEERYEKLKKKGRESPHHAASVMIGNALRKLKDEDKFIIIDTPEATRTKRIQLKPRGRLMAITAKTLAANGQIDRPDQGY